MVRLGGYLIPNFVFRRWRSLMSPPTPHANALEDLAARTLHSLLIAVLLWLALFSVVVLPFYAFRKATGFALIGGFTLLVLASLQYLSSGYVKVASWIFLSCMWFMVTVILMLSGGITNRGTMFYVAISVTATWLVGQRVAFISAGLFVVLALIMALLEGSGVTFPRYFSGSPIAVWMLVVLFTSEVRAAQHGAEPHLLRPDTARACDR